MTITCPKCQVRHDVTQRKPGENFACSCGNVLTVPKKGFPTWAIVLLILVGCSVPCLGLMAAIAVPNFIKYQTRSKALEARINLTALRIAENAYFNEHESYVPVGPVPAQVPKAVAVDFTADPGCRTLHWQPDSKVRYQYEVRVAPGGKKATIFARGDLDGNGRASEYRLEVGEGSDGQIEETDPLE